MRTTLRNSVTHLAALMAVAAVACSPEDDNGGGSATISTMASTTTASTSSDADSTDGDDSSSTADPTTDETNGGEGRAVEACVLACPTMVDCEEGDREDLALCLDDCVFYDDLFGSCDAATATLYACLADLSCEELEDYSEEISDPYPCQAEEEAEYSACG